MISCENSREAQAVLGRGAGNVAEIPTLDSPGDVDTHRPLGSGASPGQLCRRATVLPEGTSLREGGNPKTMAGPFVDLKPSLQLAHV